MCLTLTLPTEFAVNGSAIPEVDFDAGESYAGQLPIGGSSDGKLYFWFWPTTNPDQPKEILIWLNGGVRTVLLLRHGHKPLTSW